jgi:hypothetical protein
MRCCFRHTFATRQLHAGVPIAVVSKILGHGSISTTLNIYAHVMAEHMEQFERQRARILGTYRAPDAPDASRFGRMTEASPVYLRMVALLSLLATLPQ